MPQSMGGTNHQKFSINQVGVDFKSDQVCAKALPSIAPTVVHALEFDGDSASRDHN